MSTQKYGQQIKKHRAHYSGKRAVREILLLSTSASLSPEKKERIQRLLAGKVDWIYLIKLAILHNIAPLISHTFTANDFNRLVPRPYLDRLNDIYNMTTYKNVILYDELTRVLSGFNQRGIPAISLKGIALAEMLYENPVVRTISDIDILVKPDDLPRASSLLIELGYQQTGGQQSHPFHGAPYYRQAAIPLVIELHWDLEDGRLMSISRQQIWSRAQIMQIQCGPVLTLSPEDTLMFSIVQLCKEFDELKVLGDIAELLKKYEGALDWRYIVDSTRGWGIGTGAYYSLMRARDLLGAPVPAYVIEELKPEAWRRCAIGFLSSPESFVSRINWPKLRAETLILVRGLMMKHARQTMMVLKKYRGPEGRGAWLRTAIWIMLVFFAAFGINIARTASFIK